MSPLGAAILSSTKKFAGSEENYYLPSILPPHFDRIFAIGSTWAPILVDILQVGELPRQLLRRAPGDEEGGVSPHGQCPEPFHGEEAGANLRGAMERFLQGITGLEKELHFLDHRFAMEDTGAASTGADGGWYAQGMGQPQLRQLLGKH